jgi:zinc protease
MRVFRKYIKDKPGVIVSVIPEGGEPARPDNYEIQTEGDNPFPTTDYSGLTYNRPTGDTFDRSKKPEPGPSPLVPVPDFWKTTMDNGVKVIGTESTEIPTVAMQLTINGGHKMDQFAPTKSGLAVMTAQMLNESTEKYSSEEIQEELRKLGSSINVYASEDRTVLSVNTLKKNLDATLELAEEILFHPKFDQADFDRLKKQQLEGIQANYKDPSAIANLVFQRLLYGDEHIYSIPSGGIEETVNAITLEDVKAFYEKYYAPDISELVIVGDVKKNEILDKLGFIKNWETKGITVPELPEPKPGQNTKLYLMDKKGA